MQGNQEEETESQQPRVCHPSEAGKRSRNQEENRKSTTKSRSPLKAIYRSIYLSIYLPIYLSIYLSDYLGTHGNMEKRNVKNQESPKKP